MILSVRASARNIRDSKNKRRRCQKISPSICSLEFNARPRASRRLEPANAESSHDFLGSFGIFEGDTTFYLGQSIALTFEDGTQLEPEPWLAHYHSQDRLRRVEALVVS